MMKVMNEKINKSIYFSVAVILLISTCILAFDLPKVDDVPYYVPVSEDVVKLEDMTDAVDNDKISFIGSAPAMADVSLSDGDLYKISLEMTNPGEANVEVHVDLWKENYDRNEQESVLVVTPGTEKYDVELSYFRDSHPQQCKLRIFSYDENTEITIEDIRVDAEQRTVDGNGIVATSILVNAIILVLSIIFIGAYIYRMRKGNRIKVSVQKQELLWVAGLIMTILAGIVYLYHDCKLDYPLVYAGGDDLGIYYQVKTIKEFGCTLVNHRVGGLTGGDMFDYVYSDKLSFIIIKLISVFVDDVYLITNLFYFASYFLVGIMAFVVCRRLDLEKGYAFFVAILYTFTTYIQWRYGHMWLVPYYMLPLACMISMDIAKGKLDKDEEKIMPIYLIIAFLCGFTGMYYAFFSCIVFGISMFINLFDGGKIYWIKTKNPLLCIISCSFAVLVNVIPNLVYWTINGSSPLSEYSYRAGSDSEYYALKLVQMFLPRSGHRIPALAEISADYIQTYPLVNENTTATLGLIGGIGFVIALIEIMIGKRKASIESRMSFAVFIVATVGGIGSLISVFVSWPMRCYNRLSLVILFLSLLLVVRYLDSVLVRINRKKVSIGIVIGLIILGFLDQTAVYTAPDYTSFESDRDFIHEIENQMEPKDMIFVLPVLNWPSGGGYGNHIGYIESDNLKWSYGAIQGRDEAVWQQKVEAEDSESMISALREAGYDGIIFDTELYTKWYGAEAMADYSNNITYALGYQPMVSNDGTLYYWII